MDFEAMAGMAAAGIDQSEAPWATDPVAQSPCLKSECLSDIVELQTANPSHGRRLTLIEKLNL